MFMGTREELMVPSPLLPTNPFWLGGGAGMGTDQALKELE